MPWVASSSITIRGSSDTPGVGCRLRTLGRVTGDGPRGLIMPGPGSRLAESKDSLR